MMKHLYYLAQIKIGKAKELGIPENELNRASLDSFLNAVYAIAGFVAVIVIIISAINYITSSGDTSKITKAKNNIIYAVIGIVFIVGAFIITNFVLSKG